MAIVCSTSVITSTNVLLTSVVISQPNPWRKGFIIYNNSSNSVYVTLGGTSTGSTCTRLIPTFASWEYLGMVLYTGSISAIRNAGSGTVTVHELQA